MNIFNRLVVILLILVAMLIKLDSSGPVLFIQDRIGHNKRRFKLFKFRTMIDHADPGSTLVDFPHPSHEILIPKHCVYMLNRNIDKSITCPHFYISSHCFFSFKG